MSRRLALRALWGKVSGSARRTRRRGSWRRSLRILAAPRRIALEPLESRTLLALVEPWGAIPVAAESPRYLDATAAQAEALPWFDGTWGLRVAAGVFPFRIADGKFYRGSEPVFLHILNYQPLEPGQSITDAFHPERLRDDLRRLAAYQGGSEPLLLRIYPQPTAADPLRVPKEFYDGLRERDMWVVRDIYFSAFKGPTAIADGKARIDAVIAEVESADALDRIFAWEIGNEFSASGADIPVLEDFLRQMRAHIKLRMQEPGREGTSDWVTWAAFPPSDLLRTDGSPIRAEFDYYSMNAYSYDPERIRDHQAGPVTGTPYAGYVEALYEAVQRFDPGKSLVISETGLPDSPEPVVDQARLHPWYPTYRRGGLNDQQVAEAAVDRYMDVRLPGLAAGVAFFEWLDEWHKAGSPSVQNHPEEYFGLGRFEPGSQPGSYELHYKLQQESVHTLFTADYHPAAPVVVSLAADDATLLPGESTTLHAAIDPDAPGPVWLRWESSRGRIVGDGQDVQFTAGDAALGDAVVTVVAVDALGRASIASLPLAIEVPADPSIEVLTLGYSRASGRVANVDLDQVKVVLYVETNQQWVQPYADAPQVYVGPDGYWWSTAFNYSGGKLLAWVVPRDFDPPATRPLGASPPTGTVASVEFATLNDTDNDLLRDDWETTYLGGLGFDRYDDPDGDAAQNLEEFLAGQRPDLADNDRDGPGGVGDGPGGVGDGLPDNWERLYLGSTQYSATDDPDGDGLANSVELGLGIHPGRRAPDADRDGLPDRWEVHYAGSLAIQPGDDPNGDGLSNLLAYELAVSPWSYFHTSGTEIVADAAGTKIRFRGVNLPGLEFGSFENYPYTGTEGVDFSKPLPAELDAIAALGANLVRLPFEWARLAPGWQPGHPLPANLDADYLALLDEVVDAAGQRGLYVLLDMHDFLKYWSGQGTQEGVNASLPHQALLAHTWRLLAAHYADHPAVLGYDLMNEPVREAPGSTHWHAIAQQVVDAIRQVDRNHLIVVEGPSYSLASDWPVENPAPFLTDRIDPPRIVYSPHVYFDADNDSRYDQPGEAAGPVGAWTYYVRDRLLPALDWAEQYQVPLLIGEVGVPCTPAWAEVLDHAMTAFLDPLQVSTAVWHYLDPQRWPYEPIALNVAGCPELLAVLAAHPGGTYAEREAIGPVPIDSRIYDDGRVNPWHLDGSWGAVTVDDQAADRVFDGSHAMAIDLGGAWGGLKFLHQFGLDTRRFPSLRFWIFPTSAGLDFALFTTGPLPDSPVFPADYSQRPHLADFVPGGLTVGQWQLVEIPLASIADPAESVITSIAFQDDDRPDGRFYLDRIGLVPYENAAGTGNAASFSQQDHLNPSGDGLWLRCETSRSGYLTLEVPGSGTAITLYDENRTALAASAVVGGNVRIDWPAQAAGETYYAHLLGAQTDVSLRVANLVRRQGAAVTVFGTGNVDQFEFQAAPLRRVSVNGLAYDFPAAEVVSFALEGGGGKDVAVLTGSDGSESAVLYPDRGTIKGPGYSVTLASIEHKTVDAGGGTKDIVKISGSNGSDTYMAGSTEAVVLSPGYSTRVIGFDNVSTTARIGVDKATFTGSNGADTFVGRPTYSKFFGPGFYVGGQDFDEVTVEGTPGQGDAAYFTDSPGDEAVLADPSQATMTGYGFKYSTTGFDRVFAIARDGGTDTAVLTDGPADDTFDAYPDYATLHGPGFWVQAKYFDEVKAYGTAGGINTANFFDSPGNDTLEASYSETKMVTYRADNYAYDFLVANAYGYQGGTDTAHLHGTAGNDTFKFYGSTAPMYGRLTAKVAGGALYDRAAKAFDNVYAYGENSGTDIAYLYDSAGDDAFVGKPDESRLSSPGYLAVAKAFDEVHAQASGGTDTAELNDSEWDDALDATTTSIKLSSNNSYLQYLYEVLAFDSVTAKSSTGRDTKNIASEVDNLMLVGAWE